MKILCSFLLLLIGIPVFGQSGDIQIDSLRSLIYQEKSAEAQRLSDSLMKAHPDNGDYRYFNAVALGQIGLADSGILILEPLLKENPPRKDVLELEYSLHFQAQHYAKIDSMALEIIPMSPEYTNNWQSHIWVYAVAKIKLGEYNAADSLLHLLETVPENAIHWPGLKRMRRDLERDVYHNQARINYTYEQFSNTLDPWQFATAEVFLGNQMNRIGGRLNYASRYERHEGQIEIESYNHFRNGWFLQGNLAASLQNKNLFPTAKIGAELFKQWGQRGEATLGYTYMNFSGTNRSIYTASLGYYPGNWWLSLRGYAVPTDGNMNPSALLFARRYFRTSDEYAGILAGYGAIIPQQLTAVDYARLESFRFGFQWQWRIMRRTYFTGIVAISSEDYTFQQNIFRHSFQGGLFYRFK